MPLSTTSPSSRQTNKLEEGLEKCFLLKKKITVDPWTAWGTRDLNPWSSGKFECNLWLALQIHASSVSVVPPLQILAAKDCVTLQYLLFKNKHINDLCKSSCVVQGPTLRWKKKQVKLTLAMNPRYPKQHFTWNHMNHYECDCSVFFLLYVLKICYLQRISSGVLNFQ